MDDVATLQRLCNSLAAQRNAALDAHAHLDARLGALAEENAALKQRIENMVKLQNVPEAV